MKYLLDDTSISLLGVLSHERVAPELAMGPLGLVDTCVGVERPVAGRKVRCGAPGPPSDAARA